MHASQLFKCSSQIFKQLFPISSGLDTASLCFAVSSSCLCRLSVSMPVHFSLSAYTSLSEMCDFRYAGISSEILQKNFAIQIFNISEIDLKH